MLSIEEYIARRKKEDKLDEYDINKRADNIRICVNYVFEYFNNYQNITEVEEKTALKKSFTKGRKQEFEVLMMHYWLHSMVCDDEGWQEYLEKVLPSLK